MTRCQLGIVKDVYLTLPQIIHWNGNSEDVVMLLETYSLHHSSVLLRESSLDAKMWYTLLMNTMYTRLCARFNETVAIPKKSPGLHNNSYSYYYKIYSLIT